MRAVVFAGDGKIRVDDVPQPKIEDDHDAIVAVRVSSICGSDLHLLNGKTPGMRVGGVIGHEFVGSVVEVGDKVTQHRSDSRVLGSFLIACGVCSNCLAKKFNHCIERRALGLGTLTGDLDGAQAEFVRIPHADINLHQLKGALAGLKDEEALFAGDVMATGFHAAAVGDVKQGDAVVVIGAGPVGIFCAVASWKNRPSRVLVLDTDPERVKFASSLGLEGVDISSIEPQSAVNDKLGGRLADVSMDAVGHVDAFKSAMRTVGEGGRVVVVGVYGTERYPLAMGAAWIRALDIRFAGMANVQGHWEDALITVAKGDIDPSVVITHRLPLEDAEEGYRLFANREAMKVTLKP
jgi:2-desacetyl-2-hydroxyethyl bacteriochlorophyllide A dehydrogenase